MLSNSVLPSEKAREKVNLKLPVFKKIYKPSGHT